ncbi:MAG: polyprenyl synthetase family protein [Planctomycetota bacterium]
MTNYPQPNDDSASLTNVRKRVESYLSARRSFIDKTLDERLPRERESDPAKPIASAMRMACSGGKRFRSILALAAGETLGAKPEALEGLCVAVECFHSASIVFDDLPSMDDAVFRRGQAPLHRAFDESTAILAANGLIMLAFESLVSHSPGATSAVLVELVSDAAKTVGHGGMIEGQFIDLTKLRKKNPSRKSVEFVHEHKTGKLFEFAVRGAAHLANANDHDVTAVTRYARNVGIAFQLGDDVLAVTRTREELGKESRTDTGKSILSTPFDRAWAQGTIDRLIGEAVSAVAHLGERASSLNDLALVIRDRARADC